MADHTVTLSVERTGAAGFSGAQPLSGPAALRGREATREAARSEKPSAPEQSEVPEKSGNGVRLVQDADSGRPIVEILDKKTGEVMYQIPPEAVRQLAELLQDLTGSMVDTVA